MVIKDYLKNDLFEGILGREEFIELHKNKKFQTNGVVLISIHYPDEEYHSENFISNFDDFIQVKFWDVEEQIGDNYIPIPQEIADNLRYFIDKNSDKRFLIHCSAGQSRSAGVGLAVECLIKHKGDDYLYKTSESDIKSFPRYTPNYVVYDKIINSKS